MTGDLDKSVWSGGEKVPLNRELRRALKRAKKRGTDFTSSGGLRTGFTRHGTMQTPTNAEAANKQLRDDVGTARQGEGS